MITRKNKLSSSELLSSVLVKTSPKNPEDTDMEDTLGVMDFPIDKSFEVGKNKKDSLLNKEI